MLARVFFVFMPRVGTVSKPRITFRRLWMRSLVRTRRLWRTMVMNGRKASAPVPRIAVSRIRRHSNFVAADTWEVT